MIYLVLNLYQLRRNITGIQRRLSYGTKLTRISLKNRVKLEKGQMVIINNGEKTKGKETYLRRKLNKKNN